MEQGKKRWNDWRDTNLDPSSDRGRQNTFTLQRDDKEGGLRGVENEKNNKLKFFKNSVSKFPEMLKKNHFCLANEKKNFDSRISKIFEELF